MGRRSQPELKSGKIECHQLAHGETILSFLVLTLLFGGCTVFFLVDLTELVHSLVTDPSGEWFGVIPVSLCALFLSGGLANLYADLMRGEYHRTMLLSDRTLAIVHPGRHTTFIKPRDLKEYRPDKTRLVLRSGKPLPLWPWVAVNENGKITLAILRRWYGEETVDAARAALRDAHTLPWERGQPVIPLVATVILAAVCFGVLEMWFLLKVTLIILVAVVCGTALWLSYAAHRVVYPLRNEAEHARSTSAPDNRAIATAKIQRVPESPPDALNYAWDYIFVLLACTGLIPVFKYLLSVSEPDWNPWPFIVCSVFYAALIVGYLFYRLHNDLVRGDLFITLLLSSRTLAIVRPKQPVAYVKPAECAAFIPRGNMLELHDGRRHRLEPTGLVRAIHDAFTVLRRRWWPDAVNTERTAQPKLHWKHYTVAMLFFALGLLFFGLESYFNTFWCVAIGVHLVFAGILYMLYRTVCVPANARIELESPNAGQRASTQ